MDITDRQPCIKESLKLENVRIAFGIAFVWNLVITVFVAWFIKCYVSRNRWTVSVYNTRCVMMNHRNVADAFYGITDRLSAKKWLIRHHPDKANRDEFDIDEFQENLNYYKSFRKIYTIKLIFLKV